METVRERTRKFLQEELDRTQAEIAADRMKLDTLLPRIQEINSLMKELESQSNGTINADTSTTRPAFRAGDPHVK